MMADDDLREDTEGRLLRQYATPVNQLNGDGVARESTKGSRWFHHGVSLATVTDGRRGYRPGARRRPAPHRRRQHYWGARQRRVASPRRAGPVKELIDGSLSFSPLALFLSFFFFYFSSLRERDVRVFTDVQCCLRRNYEGRRPYSVKRENGRILFDDLNDATRLHLLSIGFQKKKRESH